jgi:hypothetical protein
MEALQVPPWHDELHQSPSCPPPSSHGVPFAAGAMAQPARSSHVPELAQPPVVRQSWSALTCPLESQVIQCRLPSHRVLLGRQSLHRSSVALHWNGHGVLLAIRPFAEHTTRLFEWHSVAAGVHSLQRCAPLLQVSGQGVVLVTLPEASQTTRFSRSSQLVVPGMQPLQLGGVVVTLQPNPHGVWVGCSPVSSHTTSSVAPLHAVLKGVQRLHWLGAAVALQP